MRAFLVILVTMLLAFGASCVIWRGLLDPTLPALPPPPTARQAQFGMRMTPAESAALDRPVPAGFATGKDLAKTIDNLRRATGSNFFVNWRALEAEGLGKRSPVPSHPLGGQPLAEVLTILCRTTTPMLACHVEDGVITLSTESDLSRDTVTRVYDVRDLVSSGGAGGLDAAARAAATAAMTALEQQIKTNVAPQSWRDTAPAGFGSLRSLSGQLIITTTPLHQYELVKYLNDQRLRRSRTAFARRSGTLTGAALVTASLVLLARHLVRRRRRLRAGLCARCGYDLRASDARCPECGTAFAAASAAQPL